MDGDGKDEILYGSAAIDDDGSELWCNGNGHGDILHVGKFIKDRSGLQIVASFEEAKDYPRITPPIGRIASPSQSANKRRLASLTDSVIALPYFVPRKPFEADVGAVRAWESPYATAKLNNR